MVTDKMVEAAAIIKRLREEAGSTKFCEGLASVTTEDIAAIEAALSASDAEPVCTVAEIKAGGHRMLAPYPLDAINHLPLGTPLYAAPPAVSVKALEWDGMECRSSRGDLYSIHRLSENVWVARKNGTSISDWHGTEDAAKAAAQADYETRAALVSPADMSPVFTVAQIVDKIKDYGQDSLPTSEYRLACDDLIEAFEAMGASRVNTSQEPVNETPKSEHVIPEGWQLVPKEPTRSMAFAGINAVDRGQKYDRTSDPIFAADLAAFGDRGAVRAVQSYRAMLAAALKDASHE